ncbi:MAG TPA: ATP-binding protein [Candidatus Solibacter sp.]|nr:ATP-binding protein [Candidatus Solibacter sp.]
MRLPGRHPVGPATAPDTAAENTNSSWKAAALDTPGLLWLRVDTSLRVVEASTSALGFFEWPSLPGSVIAITRSPAIEDRARDVLAGQAGPWEVDVANFGSVLRMSGMHLGADGVFLHLEDITEVRRLEAVRADFVANLAHELRTPVASLSLAAETLAGGLPPQETVTFAARIAEETRYIEGLLRTVSELALLEGEVKLQISEFNLHTVVLDTWRRVVARQGEGQLADEVPATMWVRADPVRVAEVMQNLLENAHRFSPEGKPVTVGAAGGVDETRIWVVDHGPGIPPNELPRVFERFYKVDRARTRRGDGSGLGLALSKHLVSAHGGRIWAESGDDGGTRVTFTLPSRPA